MSRLAPLAELAAFEALDPPARLALAQALAESLGQDFLTLRALVGTKGMVGVEHVPTGMRLVAVPGGTFDMGFTADDEAELRRYVDGDAASIQSRLQQFDAMCSPVRTVTVAPFLLSVRHVTPQALGALTGGALEFDVLTPGDAATFLACVTAFRLPSEAELEYAAREGGALAFIADGGRVWATTRQWPNVSGWGLEAPSLAAWVADEWHDDYQGAPTTSEAWSAGGVPGVYRGGLLHTPDNEEELLFGLAAWRGRLAHPDDEWDVLARAARTIVV